MFENTYENNVMTMLYMNLPSRNKALDLCITNDALQMIKSYWAAILFYIFGYYNS